MIKNDYIETALKFINKKNVNYILIELFNDDEYKKIVNHSYQQKISSIKDKLTNISDINGIREITRRISDFKYISHVVGVFKDTLDWFNPNIKLHTYWVFNYLNILNNYNEGFFH